MRDVDTDQRNNGTKYLTASRLITLLQTLPPDCRIAPNHVGNLLIMTNNGDASVGIIDFLLDGEIELYEDPYEDDEKPTVGEKAPLLLKK